MDVYVNTKVEMGR